MRILFLANWPRSRATGGDYAFFKHFEPRPELRVLTTLKLPLWTAFERRVLKFYPLQALIAWLLAPRYDLVIAYSSQSGLPLALLRRLLGRRGAPLVLFDVENVARLSGPVGRLAGWALAAVERIVAPSSDQLGHYRRRWPDLARRATFLPIGIGPYPPAPPLEQALAANRIVVLGKADQGRRFRDWATLLAALRRVQQPFELLIVGREDLPPGERDDQPLPDNTRFVAYAPALELVPLIGTCRLAVLPLPDRGQSQGQLSALLLSACGRPLIAPDVLGLRDYIEHERSGLLYRPGDPQDLARCVERLLGDDALCLALGSEAARRVTQRFTDKAMGRAWQALCAEVVGK